MEIFKEVATYHATGFIINKTKIGEADEIVTLFTKRHGKIKTIAKGSRKQTSRKSGNLELAYLCRFLLAEGRNFDIISEVEVLHNYQKLTNTLEKTSYLFQILELTDRLVAERQQHNDIYHLLEQGFRVLEEWDELQWQKASLFLASFEIKLLHILGFWDVDEIVKNYDLNEKELQRLKLLQGCKLSDITRFDADKTTQNKIKSIIDRFASTVLEGYIRSNGLIEQVEKMGS